MGKKDGAGWVCLLWLKSLLNQKLSKVLEYQAVPFAVKWGQFCKVEIRVNITAR